MSFQTIKGHEGVVDKLRTYMRNGRLSGAYLFTGPEGIGKMLTARILSQAVNCLTEDSDACGDCDSCVKIGRGHHPDIHVIDGNPPEETAGRGMTVPDEDDLLAPVKTSIRAQKMEPASGEIKIERIRELQSQINLKPYEGKKKVFLINDAHRMTPEAADAFLKTLEESAEGNLIILVTSKPAVLPRTIVSRCKEVKFSPLSLCVLDSLLKRDFGLDDTSAHVLSFFTEGRIGYALHLKDTEDFIAKKNRIIDDFAVNNSGSARVFGGERTHREPENRDEMRNLLNVLAAWFRDLYVIKAGVSLEETINRDRVDDLRSQRGRYSFDDLDERMQCISEALFLTEHNINVKLLVLHMRALLWKN
ncbi:MAG: hypothetical protein PHE58_01035 [Candidatus Omnitrophica bacterium]|nr:hypothetical protein [Candidatus Omnitrophota bacterium]